MEIPTKSWADCLFRSLDRESYRRLGSRRHGKGEEKGAGGGGDKIPPVFRFKPTDKDLVEYYLLPRLQGLPAVPNNRIIETNAYAFHPDKLINELYKDRGEDAWYFLSPRARISRGGTRPTRSTEDRRGRWKASTGNKKADEAIGDGTVKFYKNSLVYHEGSVKNEKPTKWLMHEYTIPEYTIKVDKSSAGNNRTDKHVMCKIYISSRKRSGDEDEDEEASPSDATNDVELSSSSQPGPQSSTGTAASDGDLSTPQPVPAVGTSEETAAVQQTGNKRPAEEHAATAATVAQRPPQQPKLTVEGATAPPALYIGGSGAGGMQMPPRMVILQDNQTGHTMAHAGGHVTFNGPVGMQQRKVAHNEVMRRQQMAAYPGQMQLRQQASPAAFNGQAPPMQGTVMANNGRQASSVQWPPAAFNGQAPPMMGTVMAGIDNGQALSAQLRAAAFNGQALSMQGTVMADHWQSSSVQRPAATFNSQAPSMPGTVMAENGQASSVQWAPVAFNGQAPHMQGPVMGDNGQDSSVQRPAAACKCNIHAPVVQGPQVASNAQMSLEQRQQAAVAAAYNYNPQQQRAALAYNLQLAQLQGRPMAMTPNGQPMSVQPQPRRNNVQMMQVQGPEVAQNGESSAAPGQRLTLRRPHPAVPDFGNLVFGGTMMMPQPLPPQTVQPPAQEYWLPETPEIEETPEMEEKRVIQQLLDEYYRQKRIKEEAQAHGAQGHPIPLQVPPQQQQPCSNAVQSNDDREERPAEVAATTTEVARDGSASDEGDGPQRNAPAAAPQNK
uniref:NAC domain-containing protein n=1 Tax=Leersia perrieri TaxID=77586 RepID=A0A0D9W821_9ORYZ